MRKERITQQFMHNQAIKHRLMHGRSE